MHFKFSALLAGVLALSVDALPFPQPNPAPGMVTLPIKPLEQRSDEHPQIIHQQNINRGHRRLALMSGRDLPTREELASNLRKRVLSIEGDEGLSKRYNRMGVHKHKKGKATVTKAKTPGSGAVLAASFAHHHRKGGQNDQAAPTTSTSNGTSTGEDDTSADVTVANSPTDSNSLGLDIEGSDVGYLATIQMGTPPQDFLILMDSGSADLWVGSESCQSEGGGGCGNHKFLGSQGSSSFQDSNKPFQVTYGTGNVAGNIIQDNIAVAGLSLPAHTFGVATSESTDFSDDSVPFDGLMGLAQSTLSEQQTPTPIEALASAGLVADAITSFKIPRLADNKNDGEVTFGGLDSSKFDSSTLVTLNNVNKQGFWEGNMDAVTVNGQDSGLQGRTAILDTGTTLIVAPPSDAAAVHQLIQGSASDGQGGFTIPCNTNASVALTFGGTSFAIDTRDLVVQPVNANDPTGNCISGITSGNIGGATEWLVGDVFLKNAYFSTDVGKNTVSLAKLV